MHYYCFPLSLFAFAVAVGAFSPVDDLTAFDLGNPITTDSNLGSEDLFAESGNPMDETSLENYNNNDNNLFSQLSENEPFSLNDDDLFAADHCPPDPIDGLSKRNDNNHPACSTTKPLKVPNLPTTLDQLTNQLSLPEFPRQANDDPVIQDLMRMGVQMKDERHCSPDSAYYLCCNCDPNAAFMVCLDCVPIITLLEGCYAPYMEMCCPVYGVEILDALTGTDSLDEWEETYDLSFDRNPGPQGGTAAVLCHPASEIFLRP